MSVSMCISDVIYCSVCLQQISICYIMSVDFEFKCVFTSLLQFSSACKVM